MRPIRPCVATLCILMLFGVAESQSLTIGSDAPPIKVEKWLKSSPLERFEKGKLYVIDFWATWCPPCRQTIPRLTELAKKYSGKVVFAGVSIAENQKSPQDLAYVDIVRKFVETEGAQMDYHVAVDRPDRSMALGWMEAAGESNIPTTFVIDGAGKIAWIGDPRGLQSVLDAEISGTYDIKAAQEARLRDQAKQADLTNPETNGSVAALAAAIQRKDWKAAAQTCSVIFATDRKQEVQYGPIKFLALLQTDEPAAYAYGRRLRSGVLKDSPAQLAALSQMILSEDYGPKKPDVGFALELAQQCVDASKEADPQFLDTLANAQYHANQTEKALATEQEALGALNTSTTYAPAVLNQYRSSINKHLALFRAKKS